MRTTTINPKYAYYEAFIRHIPDQMDEEGVYIYGGRRNLIKLFVAPDGTQFNVKRYKKPVFPSNWVYSLGLRQPKGKRAYNYPSILLERGIETPEAVAYIEDRKAGIIQHSWFISVQCPYRHLLYEMGDAPEKSGFLTGECAVGHKGKRREERWDRRLLFFHCRYQPYAFRSCQHGRRMPQLCPTMGTEAFHGTADS